MSGEHEPSKLIGSGWSVLLEDGPILAINKPAGLLTQAPPGVPSLESEVKSWLKERFEKPGNVYLGIPQRLDRVVSGVIVFTRNSKAAARMAEQFEQRTILKRYQAIVAGEPDPPAGILDDWIRKLPEQSRAEVVSPETPGARECRLSYRVLASGEAGALIEVEPHTGRMHQIRVQLASRSWPILGDAQYGSTASPFGANQRIALHSHSLTFLHPVRYDLLTVTAPIPNDWPLMAPLTNDSFEILGSTT